MFSQQKADKHAPNDLKFDPETHLLFCLYYEAAWGYQRSTASAAAYLERFKDEIKATGRVLEWLYLAEPDKESRLGWRPTSFLMSLLAKPRKFVLKSARECASAWDKEAFDSMISTVLADVDNGLKKRAHVILVLSFLNLIRWARNGDVVLTRTLLALVAARRREEDYLRDVRMMSSDAVA